MFYYSTPPPTRRNSEDLESHNIAALCHTFKLLIDQLPMDIFVFCIIDGINLYERPDGGTILSRLSIASTRLHKMHDSGQFSSC